MPWHAHRLAPVEDRQVDSFAHRPSPEEIRRALAECMTVGDIDDAMEWTPGTARRLRWEEPELGGLPTADASLGGTPVWFRATIAAWRAAWTGLGPAGQQPTPTEERPPSADEPDHEASSDLGVDAEVEFDTEPQSDPDGEPDAELDPEAMDVPQPEQDQQDAKLDPGVDLHGAEPALADQADDGVTGGGDRPPRRPASRVYGTDHDTPPPGSAPVTGTGELDAEQHVIAWASRAWRDARVVSHSRTSVVVTYRLGKGRLGDRVTRLELRELRHPATG